MSVADNRPVLVCGVGRSGTSLLQSMLAAHSCLAFPPETSFLRRLVLSGALDKALKEGGEAGCLELLDSDQLLKRTGLRGKGLLERAKETGGVSGGSLYRALLELFADGLDAPHCGDKDPRLIECLGLVHRALPEADVVHVIRDPRDILASKKKAAWSRAKNVLKHIFAGRVQIRMGRMTGPRYFRDRYHEIVYERLLADPESELKTLCEQLGLQFEVGMLAFSEAAKKLVSDSEMSWKKETLGPLLNNNKGKWESELSTWEVALVERACAEHFRVGGYDRSNSLKQLSIQKRAGVILLSGLIAALDPIYRAYRWFSVRRAGRYL